MQKHMGIFIEEEVGFRLCDFARKREVSLSEAIGELLNIGELSEESVNRLREFAEDYEVSLSEAIDGLLEEWNDESSSEPAKAGGGNGSTVLPKSVGGLYFESDGSLHATKSKHAAVEMVRREIPNIGVITNRNSTLANVTGSNQWWCGCNSEKALANGRYFLLYDSRDGILHVLHADAKFFADNRKKLTTQPSYFAKNGGLVRERFMITLSAESHNMFWDKDGKKVDFSGCKNWKIKVAAE